MLPPIKITLVIIITTLDNLTIFFTCKLVLLFKIYCLHFYNFNSLARKLSYFYTILNRSLNESINTFSFNVQT